MKFFPLMPREQDTASLIWAIVFYIFVPPIVCMFIGAILGLTVILMPLSFVVGLAGSAYTIMGIVFAILNYAGK